MVIHYARWIPLLLMATSVINIAAGLWLISVGGHPHSSLFIGPFLLIVSILMLRAKMVVLHDDRVGFQNPLGMELRRYGFDELEIKDSDKGRILYALRPGKTPRRLIAEHGISYNRAEATALLNALAPRLA